MTQVPPNQHTQGGGGLILIVKEGPISGIEALKYTKKNEGFHLANFGNHNGWTAKPWKPFRVETMSRGNHKRFLLYVNC